MKFIIILIGLFSILSGRAQQLTPGEKVVFPSPQAAQLGKFGGYALNHSTGTANISIPLHTLTEGSLRLPISLTYFYAGCRPGDEPGWIGLGWSLSAGGVITRTIKGIADETPNQGYLSRRSLIASTVNGQVPSESSYQNLMLQSGANDAQPDFFSFQFDGHSGKFVFGSDGLPKLLSSENLKITYTTTTDNIHNNGTTIINNWTVISENGTQYEFAKYEFSGGANSDNIYMPSAWYITRITSIAGDVINFNYTNPQPYHPQRRRQFGLSDQETYQNNNVVVSSNSTSLTSTNYSEEIYLTEIIGTLWRVQFNSEPYSQALNFNETRQARKLNSIQFFSPIGSSAPLKQYNFGYNLASSTANKLMLVNLSEPNANPYIFDYNSQVPATFDGTSRMVDYWGFYNSQNNLSLIPGRQGSDLEPRLEQTKLGSISRITYPTGGYTNFTYEPHQYSYVQDKTTSLSTYLITDRSYSWYRNIQGVYVSNSANTITLTKPTRIDVQLNNNSTGQGPMNCAGQNSNFVSITLPAGSYSGNAILQNTQVSFYPCRSTDTWNREGVNFTLNVKIYEPVTRHISTYGGLRVKEITDTPTGSIPAITTRYFYNRATSDTLSSGVVAQQPFYTFNPTSFANGSANFGFYRSSPFNPESMLLLYYKDVRQENDQFKTNYTFTSHVQQKDEFGRWAFFADQGQNSLTVSATSVLNLGDVQSGYYMRSLPLGVVIQDLNGNKKQETQYTYQGFYSNVVQVPALYNEYLTSYETPGQSSTIPFRLYYNKVYYIIGGWPRKTSETTTVYNSN